jgi:hypothetical protein
MSELFEKIKDMTNLYVEGMKQGSWVAKVDMQSMVKKAVAAKMRHAAENVLDEFGAFDDCEECGGEGLIITGYDDRLGEKYGERCEACVEEMIKLLTT